VEFGLFSERRREEGYPEGKEKKNVVTEEGGESFGYHVSASFLISAVRLKGEGKRSSVGKKGITLRKRKKRFLGNIENE